MSDVSIPDLKASVNIVDVIGKYLSLTKRGSEFYAMCCFHDDHKASLQVNEVKQVYKCFACGAGGDVIDFLKRKGRSMAEAIQELSGCTGPPNSVKSKKKDEWKQVEAPDTIAFEIKHYQHGKPSAIWKYTDLYGKSLGYVCRFNLETGKVVLPFTLRYNGKHYNWMWKGFDTPRPLYNQYSLINNPDKIVLVVEGEKTADAAAKIFPEFVCITWMGGARAYQYTDWTPLRGHNVILWPDNDEPGEQAMKAIGQMILKMESIAQPRVRYVRNNPSWPVHWDLADCDSAQEARAHIKNNLYQVHLLETVNS